MQRMAKGQKAGRRTHPLVLLAWEGKKREVVIPWTPVETYPGPELVGEQRRGAS